MRFRIPPRSERRAWAYNHPVKAGLYTAVWGSACMFVLMLSWSDWRQWLLPIALLPVDAAVFFAVAFVPWRRGWFAKRR